MTRTLASSVGLGLAARSAARAGSVAKTSPATATTKSDKRIPVCVLFLYAYVQFPPLPSMSTRFSYRHAVYSLCDTSQPASCSSTSGVRVVCSTSSPLDEQFQSLSRESHLSVSYICHTFFRVSGYTSRETTPFIPGARRSRRPLLTLLMFSFSTVSDFSLSPIPKIPKFQPPPS